MAAASLLRSGGGAGSLTARLGDSRGGANQARQTRLAALLAEAKHPHTAPERLLPLMEEALEVAGDGTPGVTRRFQRAMLVVEAVAAHPNAPLDVIARLVAFCPAGVCRNPALALLPLESPDFWERRVPRPLLGQLLRLPDAPECVLAYLAAAGEEWEVREEARRHVTLAGEADRDLWEIEAFSYWHAHVQHADPEARQAYADWAELGLAPAWAAGPDPVPDPDPLACLPPDAVHAIDAVNEAVRTEPWARMAADPRCPAAQLGLFARDEKLAVRLAVARNPACPPHLLEVLGREGSVGLGAGARDLHVADALMTEAVARNRHAPPSVVAHLARRGEPALRRLARRHPNAPRGVAAQSRGTARSHGPVHPLCRFLAVLRGDQGGLPYAVHRAVDSPDWRDRLAAALTVPRQGGVMRRGVSRDLLRLSDDGNRIVRAAARTRIEEPGYRFVL